MMILCIKDHVCSSINNFHVRIRSDYYPQFCCRPFELKKKNNPGGLQISENHCSCIFYVL